jgi:hypothetical protein
VAGGGEIGLFDNLLPPINQRLDELLPMLGFGGHFNPALQNAIMANRQMPTIPIVTPSIVSSLFMESPTLRNTNG